MHFERSGATALLALILCTGSGSAQNQATDTIGPVRGQTVDITLRSGHETPAGRALMRVLRDPYIVLDGRGREVNLPRGTRFDSSVVIISSRATVGATVRGHVVVVGGDLFLHPGAQIDGDAIAIGGGVYRSTLASIGGGADAFRDETFAISRAAAGIDLGHEVRRIDYETQLLTWPLGTGLRMPAYSRIDGIVVPWGPIISMNRGRLTIDPTLSYRSDLGAIDPAARVIFDNGALFVIADARRGTFSNDGWIRRDVQNSLSTIWSGRDTRNYYRADRMELRAGHRLRPGTAIVEPWIGARNELGWATGAELSRDSHPWSVFGRDSINGIFRANPQVPRGRIVSALAGAALRWNPEDVRLTLSGEFERAQDRRAQSPTPGDVGAPFTQLTLHGTVSFPTFAGQRLTARAHAVTSSSGEKRPPPQRYAYLGGSGTIPTLELLSEGGTELVNFAANYAIPIQAIDLPYIGSPILTLRYMTGAAGVDSLPKLTQNVGARLGFRFITAEFLMDPATKEKRFGVGFAFTY